MLTALCTNGSELEMIHNKHVVCTHDSICHTSASIRNQENFNNPRREKTDLHSSETRTTKRSAPSRGQSLTLSLKMFPTASFAVNQIIVSISSVRRHSFVTSCERPWGLWVELHMWNKHFLALKVEKWAAERKLKRKKLSVLKMWLTAV